MKKIIHKANSRGHADHGWLKSYHTFSFANYQDRSRMNFGVLRVLNDDKVAAGMGFGTHSHDNMEIISIPLQGALEHKDSMGTSAVITKGEVQIMSAGTGISHSEFNHSKTEQVNFLQIWVFPKVKNIAPRYEQKIFNESGRLNKFQTIVSPIAGEGVLINQDAYFSLLNLEENKNIDYGFRNKNNGLYIFVLNGDIQIDGTEFNRRDGIGISEAENVLIESKSNSEILLMEIPLQLN